MTERPHLGAVADVLEAHRDALVAVPGVVGTAIGLCDGVPCIRVFVVDASAAAGVPASIDGYRVHVETSGRFDAR